MTSLRYGIIAVLVGLLSSQAASPPGREFRIEAGRVGNLLVGMRASTVMKLYPSWAIQGAFVYGEGIAAPVLEVRLARDQKKPSLSIGLGETSDHRFTIVRGIDVLDPRFRTATGIGPGSPISDLRAAFRDLSIESFEDHTILNSKAMHMSFEIEYDSSLYEKDGQFKPIGALPADIPVISVWVYN